MPRWRRLMALATCLMLSLSGTPAVSKMRDAVGTPACVVLGGAVAGVVQGGLECQQLSASDCARTVAIDAAAGAAGSLVGGAFGGRLATTILGRVGGGVLSGAAGGSATSIVAQYLATGQIDWRQVQDSAMIGGIFGGLGAKATRAERPAGRNTAIEHANPSSRAVGSKAGPAIPNTASAAARAQATKAAGAAADDWPVISGIDRDAAKGKGNFGIGSGTVAQAETAGRAWVGDGARLASDGKTWLSQDGLRQWRPPSYKPRLDKWQSNFEARWELSGQWQTNGHLDIVGAP